jgi:hypothetical protein
VMSALMLGISLTLALAYAAFLPKEEER